MMQRREGLSLALTQDTTVPGVCACVRVHAACMHVHIVSVNVLYCIGLPN